ncbi:MAG: ribosome recycling factor [candidate division SR1 bacterium]|nr:MAG: ribosome recycling factor [candidate division SR1 bacterium]
MELAHYEQQMKKALAYLEQEFAGLQVGRATSGLVENINIESEYGTMKLNTLGHITVLDTTTLKIEPWNKADAKPIETAIFKADLGVGIDNQGSHLLIKIPALTQERRDHIAKQVKAMGEEAKTQIRQVRQDAMSDTKKQFTAKEISEDVHKANEKNIDELTKTWTTKIDSLVKAKSDEVMKI